MAIPIRFSSAIIQGHDVTLYSFHARSNFMSVQVVQFQGTTLNSFSHSIGIDLDREVKDKISNIQRIQKESTTVSSTDSERKHHGNYIHLSCRTFWNQHNSSTNSSNEQ